MFYRGVQETRTGKRTRNCLEAEVSNTYAMDEELNYFITRWDCIALQGFALPGMEKPRGLNLSIINPN